MTRTAQQKKLRKIKKELAARPRKNCTHPEKNALTKQEALAAALRSTRRSGLPIRWYECECGYVHLTRVRRRIRV